jgi:hypothetical protein
MQARNEKFLNISTIFISVFTFTFRCVQELGKASAASGNSHSDGDGGAAVLARPSPYHRSHSSSFTFDSSKRLQQTQVCYGMFGGRIVCLPCLGMAMTALACTFARPALRLQRLRSTPTRSCMHVCINPAQRRVYWVRNCALHEVLDHTASCGCECDLQ